MRNTAVEVDRLRALDTYLKSSLTRLQKKLIADCEIRVSFLKSGQHLGVPHREGGCSILAKQDRFNISRNKTD